MHGSRGGVDAQALRLSARGRDATLDYATAWAASRPRTVFLLREEAETWNRGGPLRLALPAT